MSFLLDNQNTRWSVSAHYHRPVSTTISVVEADQWKWRPVSLPVDIISFLRKENDLPDPYVAQNDLECRWVEELDWAFKAEFEIPEELTSDENSGLALELRGVDCYAEIYLNQVKLGATENQFREYRFSIDDCLVGFANELIIYIRSAKHVTASLERVHGQLPAGFDTTRVHARRCQCLTGWDWAARLTSAGILEIPVIEPDPPITLLHPHVYVKDMAAVDIGATSADYATLAVEVDVHSQRRGKGTIKVQLQDPAGQLVGEGESTARLSVGKNRVRMTVRVASAELWWPVGLGEAPLYRANFSLAAEDRTGQTFDASIETRFGVRTATIDRRKLPDGESFTPLINGHPVFCRGANWIPVSMLPSENTEEKYRELLAAAAGAGMNCLRIWGGGVYETELFYELCDQLGILVWQDFMFACAAYPTYREFTNEVVQEAEYQLQRLRNHPSIFIWCGNNENEWLHQIGELKKGNERRVIGEEIWSRLLKDKVEELDPSRPYHQSSPFGKNRDDFNDQQTGDRHNWECWGRWQSYDVYLSDTGRFLSEFGFQGMPSRASIDKFAPGASTMNDRILMHHNKMPQGQERLVRYALQMFELPVKMDDWIDCLQRLQAEILRRAVEHWRRRAHETSGALIWQLHDAYPAISWSLIDFYREPKLAYLAAKRFFAPALISVSLEEEGVEVGAFSPDPALPSPVPSIEVSGDGSLPDKPPTKRSITCVLINDTSIGLAGTLTMKILRDGALQQELQYELGADSNSVSAPVRHTLEELEITDLTSMHLEVTFKPHEPSLSQFNDLCTSISARIEALLNPVAQWAPDFKSGFKVETLLVEPKYFRWPSGVTINGIGRPAWDQNIVTRSVASDS